LPSCPLQLCGIPFASLVPIYIPNLYPFLTIIYSKYVLLTVWSNAYYYSINSCLLNSKYIYKFSLPT
jgi:hypothetical protein